MVDLFRRRAEFSISGASGRPALSFRAEGIRISFSATKTENSQPNECSMVVYNLNRDTRVRLSEKKDSVVLQAGYEGSISQLFVGTINTYTATREGPDWVSSLQLLDGSVRSKRTSRSFPARTSFKDVVLKAAEDTGLKLGNLEQQLNRGTPRSVPRVYNKGVSISGDAFVELDKLMDTAGYVWSVQSGVISVRFPDESNTARTRIITPESGMVDSPDISDNQILKVRALLLPGLLPGDRIQIKSRDLERKAYEVKQLTHTGDTHAQPWYTEIQCQVLKAETPAGV